MATKRRSGPSREPDPLIREAKLFLNGRSQAVRLPADCRFEGEAVYVKKWRGTVILLPKENPWQPLIESIGTFSADFMASRDQGQDQDRAELETLFEEED